MKLKSKDRSIELTLDEIPPNIRKILQEIYDKKKQRGDEEDEHPEAPQFPYQNNGNPEDRELESRGIIVLDREISKQSLAKASTKLLAYHFNPNFKEPIQIILNSPGGYLDAAWAFIDVMDCLRLPIRTIAMGEIASAAAMIFVAGDERVMAPNSSAMIHNFSTWSAGTYPELIAARKAEDLQAKRIVDHFIKHSRYKTKKDIESKIVTPHDNWLSPQEMKSHGLCDLILSSKERNKKKK